MTRSRHRRSEGSGEPASLPTWAQRHLDEAGTAVGSVAATTHRRRATGRPARPAPPVRPGTDSPLRGWGLAILSVAAAVTAVPLAVTAVANDRSDDPLPTVDTFTAGAPGPLQGGQGAPTTRRGTTEFAGDPSTGGVLEVPGAPAAAPAPVVVPVPQPAAVVRPTTPAVPTTITPRAAAPTTTTGATKPTTTTSDEGKSATKPTSTTKKPTSTPKQDSSGSDDGGSTKKQDGPVTGLVKGVGNTLGGVTGSLGL